MSNVYLVDKVVEVNKNVYQVKLVEVKTNETVTIKVDSELLNFYQEGEFVEWN
jgi:hypothetical protein